MEKAILNDAVFRCSYCNSKCCGLELEISESKHITCSKCLEKIDLWTSSLQGKE